MDNLVSVESQSEYSITTGKRETRIFLKMYVDAVKSGLVADMGAERWTTLCVIASFMNEKGECYPTQSQIAKGLGVSRQTASKYVRRLLDYRWDERPVISAVKNSTNGKFTSNGYRLEFKEVFELPKNNDFAIIKPVYASRKVLPYAVQEKERKIDGYTQWVEGVKIRDNYSCVVCGIKGVPMVAHHLYSYADNPKLRIDLENGVTLCKDGCHKEFHKMFGYGNNTNEQFEQYVNDRATRGCRMIE